MYRSYVVALTFLLHSDLLGDHSLGAGLSCRIISLSSGELGS